MKHDHHQLFVYGSLRSGFQHPAYTYISRYFSFVGYAKLQGILFDMGSFPAAKAATDGHFITGELYTINNEDEFSWAIGQLDDYEGLNAEDEETAQYIRTLSPVYTLENNVVLAWVYWFNGDTTGKTVIESGDVLEYFFKKK